MIKPSVLKNAPAKTAAAAFGVRALEEHTIPAPGLQPVACSCPCGGGCPRCAGVQAKLEVSQPGDELENEADRATDTVMRMPEPQTHEPVETEKDDEDREALTELMRSQSTDSAGPNLRRREEVQAPITTEDGNEETA